MDNSTATPASTPADPGGAEARWRYLRGEVARQLAAFQRRRRRDKRKAFTLQMATVTLSAAVTILLGLRTSDATRTWLLNIALVLGAVITVLAAAEAFFTHQRLWLLRTATVRRLETLSRHLDFYAAGLDGQPADPVMVGRCLDELDAIIADDQKSWRHLRESAPAAHETALSLATAHDPDSDSARSTSSPADS